MTLLPGHRATGLTLLDCGTFRVRGSVRGGERIIGIPAWLVDTDRGARILIDGGFPPGYDAAMAVRDGLPAFGTLLTGAGQTVSAQLALLGLTPADITLHVLTHGHIDHVGALPLIRCPLVVGAGDRAEPRPLYFGTARPVDWPDVPTHAIPGDLKVCDGLTLIATPGHTPGHLSALVTLPGATWLLAADAINRRTEPAEGFPDAMDAALAARSAARLHALQQRTGATMIWGHDPAQWPTLPRAPRDLQPGSVPA